MSILGRRLKKRGSSEEQAIGEAVHLPDKAKALEERVQKLDFETKARESCLKALEEEVEQAKAVRDEAQAKLKKSEGELWRLVELQAEEITKMKAEAIEFEAGPGYQQALAEARLRSVAELKANHEFDQSLTYKRQKVVYLVIKKTVQELEARLPLESSIQLRQIPSLRKGYAFLAYKRSLDDLLQGVSNTNEDEEDEEEEEADGGRDDEGGEGTTPLGTASEPAPLDVAGVHSNQPEGGPKEGDYAV